MKKILSIIMLLTLVVALSGCVIDGSTASSGVTFKLKGDNVVVLTTGESYLDYGFTAKDGTKDISSSVKIEGEVDNRTPGVYFIEYVLDYNGEETRLLRAIVVNETTVIMDPNEVLYDGTCDNVEIH